ncbi:glutathione s transferase d10 isoform a-related [Holotrichia oblita]|uniref:Glutathione s transferase d10 isoform a-related n=1 Tax=Holotrichia oblita TaxID=644536 RepID=A0ACB9TTZ3_HOLOL|nr:glutathione s transferase d10 isoform a-related [Holotrichia oblita]
MAPKLYSTDLSPPCRAVLLVSKALGLSLNVQECNLRAGEHMTAEYLKLNPQHTVPTLVDGDTVITNSHAITIYLVEKYGNNDLLYPKDVDKRPLVNQRLFFDEGTMFQILFLTMKYSLLRGEKIPELNKERAEEAYGFLETFLEGQEWVAGNTLTIADLHLIATVTTLNVVFPLNKEKYLNIVKWIEKCKALPYYEENARGLQAYSDVVIPILSKV